MWVQGRLTKKQVTTRPSNICHPEWSNVSKVSQREAINKWSEENRSWTLRENSEAFPFVPEDDPDNEETMNNARRNLEIRSNSSKESYNGQNGASGE